MEFGYELDDDLFETPREKKEEAPLLYQAKICDNRWFKRNSHALDGEALVCLKHEADYLYLKKKYSHSEIVYEQCLEKIPTSNSTVKRDCIEGLARSLLHQGKALHALEWAVKLHAASCNIDQKIVSWSLLADTYHKLKMYQEELSSLQNCIQVHPWNSDFWLRLAYCYIDYFGINLLCYDTSSKTGSSFPSVCYDGKKEQNDSLSSRSLLHKKNEDYVQPVKSCVIQDTDTPFCKNVRDVAETDDSLNEGEIYYYKDKDCNNSMNDLHDRKISCHAEKYAKQGIFFTCACLVRTRLLLQGCYSGHRSFGRKKNESQQKMIVEHIENLNVSKAFKDLAVHMLSKDIASEFQDANEDNEISDMSAKCDELKKQSNECLDLSRNLFEAQWFSWIQDYFAES